MQSNTNSKKDLNKNSDQVGLKESAKEIYQPVKKLMQEKTKIHDSNPEAEQLLTDEKQMPLKVYWESKLQKMIQKPKQFEADQAQYQIKKNSTIQQQQSEPIQQEKQSQSNDIQITKPDDEVKDQICEKKLYLPKIPSKFKSRDEMTNPPKIFYQVKQQQQKDVNNEEKKTTPEVQDQISLKIYNYEPETEAQLAQSLTAEQKKNLIKESCWNLFEEKEEESKSKQKTEQIMDKKISNKDSWECLDEKLNCMDACQRMDWLIQKIKQLCDIEKKQISKVCENKDQIQSEISWCQNTLLDENIQKIEKNSFEDQSSNLNLFEQIQIKSQADQKNIEQSNKTVYPELIKHWNEQVMPQIKKRSDTMKSQTPLVTMNQMIDENKSSECMKQVMQKKQEMIEKNEIQDPMVTPELKKREEQMEIPELFDSVMGSQVIQKPQTNCKSNATSINYQIDISEIKQNSDSIMKQAPMKNCDSQNTTMNAKLIEQPKIIINIMQDKIQQETNPIEIVQQSQKDQDNYNLQKLFESTLQLPKTNQKIEEKPEKVIEESIDSTEQSQKKNILEDNQNESYCMEKLFASIMQTQSQYQKLDSESQAKMLNEMSQYKSNKLEIIKEIMQDTQFEDVIQQQFMGVQNNGDSQDKKNQYQEISQQDNDQLSASVWESLSKSWVNIKNRIVGDKQI